MAYLSDYFHLYRDFPVARAFPITWPKTWSFIYSDCVTETDDTYSVSYDVPGVEAKDVIIIPKGNTINITYTRKKKGVEQSAGFSHTLPESVDIKTCDPVLKNGVLTINFKKVKKESPSIIKVREE